MTTADRRSTRERGKSERTAAWGRRTMVLAALLGMAGVAGLAGALVSKWSPPAAGTPAYGNRTPLSAFLRQEDNVPYDGRFT